ncbi:MAG: hypothetical protein ABJF11_02655 [Reichenbachiella sp.]|uniref:hypothetical protein n=1 Tax=Reichenbachiella sp. TaxID=2184521 RepID=UPI0032644C1A
MKNTKPLILSLINANQPSNSTHVSNRKPFLKSIYSTFSNSRVRLVFLGFVFLLTNQDVKAQIGYNSNYSRYNTFKGEYAGFSSPSEAPTSVSVPFSLPGYENAFFGDRSGYKNVEGSGNTFIGSHSGYKNMSGKNNVFVGYKSGYNETGSNKLYIDNSDTSSPLIWGDFSANQLRFNGAVDVTGALDVTGVLSMQSNLKMGDKDLHQVREVEFIDHDDNTGGTDNKYRLLARDGAIQAYNGGFVVGNYANGTWSDLSDGTLIVERKVGIGTTAPSYGALHVYKDATIGGWTSPIDPGGAGIRIQDAASSMYLDGNSIFSNGNLLIGTYTDSYLSFGTKNNEHVRIDKDGKVGLGTQAPGHILHVRGNPSEDGDRDILGYFESSASSSQDAGIAIKGARSGSTALNAFVDFDIYDNNESTTTFTMGTIGAGKENGAGINGQLRFFTNHDGSLEEQMRIDKTGRVGIGTTSPDHALSVMGRINVSTDQAHETTQSIQIWHTAKDGNIGTSAGELRIRKGENNYLSFKKSTSGSIINSHESNLILKTDGATGLEIDQNGDVLVKNNLKMTGHFQLDTTFVQEDPQEQQILNMSSDGSIGFRKAETLTPWVVREVLNAEGLTEHVITCDPKLGTTCSCESTIVAELGLYDMNGNIKIGEGAYIDNDMIPGNYDVADDWIRINNSVEVSSSSAVKGFVLRDFDARQDHFLNFHQKNGISYFSNSNTSAIPEDDHFMKADKNNNVSFPGQVSMPNFKADMLSSSGDLLIVLDSDESADDGTFRIGTGDPNDGVSWKENFNLTATGKATFSFNLSGPGNRNQIVIDGATGGVFLTGDLTSGDNPDSPKVNIESATGNASFQGTVQSKAIETRIVGGSEAKAITVFNTTDHAEVFRVYNNGIVEAKEVLVSLDIWHDEVFEDGYGLMPIGELEEYVNQNHHLPEVPAESEVLEKGVNVGQMEALLLKKIEELTLYVIDQNRQLKQQAQKTKQLEHKLD